MKGLRHKGRDKCIRFTCIWWWSLRSDEWKG